MKNIIILIAFIFSAAIFSNIFGQQAAPPGAGDKDLGDKNIKTRSIDLERVDRDSAQTKNPAASPNVTAEDKLAAKYAKIKADFEQIQLSQNAIIKAYQGSGSINYAQISTSASEINNSSQRLDSNLFSVTTNENPDDEKEKKTGKEEPKPSKNIRDLIVELDNAIGNFASSSMFQNLRLIDPKVAIKTRLDLKKINELSADLNAEAQKSAGN